MRLLALLLTCTLAFGADKAAKPSDAKSVLTQFQLGPAVIGSFKVEEAKGKPVVIDFWGVQCPPCIAALPELEKLHKLHKDKVRFVGVESQMHTKAQIEPVIKKAGVTYPIVSGFQGLPPAVQVSGLPHVTVLDAAGKIAFDGSPFDPAFEKAVKSVATGARK